MPTTYTLNTLRTSYEGLFATMTITDSAQAAADQIVTQIAAHQSIYETITDAVGVPWPVVGIFHSMESSLNFTTHLYNGDPLTARTVHAPPGRPKTGSPPFTFAESAIDALKYDGLAGLTGWDVPATLFRLEKYNGWGYRRVPINTPYLWSFSNHYTKGKYVEVKQNGKYVPVFESGLVSAQCGAAVLLRRMLDQGLLSFSSQPVSLAVMLNGVAVPQVPAFSVQDTLWIAPRPLTVLIPGLSIVAVSAGAATITVAYQAPGAGSDTPATVRVLPGRLVHGTGHVPAEVLIEEVLQAGLAFDTTVIPNQLRITLPAS